jgi:hypothetical protein
MYFITEAADKDEAVSEVDKVLETEVELCDSYNTLYNEVRPIDEPAHAFLLELEKDNNPDEMAEDYFFKQGLFLKEDGNLDDGDYNIPQEDKGWFVVIVDFHY